VNAPTVTAQAADRLFSALQDHWCEDENHRPTDRAVVRDWFAANWPAGGAVTGELAFDDADALAAEIRSKVFPHAVDVYGDTVKRTATILRAARLSAPQPVEFDVEAAVTELCYLWHHSTEGMFADMCRAVLTRHAAAPAVAQVVVAPSDLVQARALAGQQKMQAFPTFDHAVAAALTDMLRARAGTAGQTTGAQWVRRPEGSASALVVPEDGVYSYRLAHNGMIGNVTQTWGAGRVISDDYDAIRRIDTDAPTTWIERTPATAGGWTAADIPDGAIVCYEGRNPVRWFTAGVSRDDVIRGIAVDGFDVTSIYILPPVEATP
jgi:hypothetical protein